MAAENLTMSQLYDLLKTNLELVQKGREEDKKRFEELRAEDLKLTEEKSSSSCIVTVNDNHPN